MNKGRVIAVDFDGCLCTDKFPEIGDPNYLTIGEAKRLQRAGAYLILWTCREGQLLQEAVEACRSWGLEFDAVNENLAWRIEKYGNDCRKIGADEYWDDKAVFWLDPSKPTRMFHGIDVEVDPYKVQDFMDNEARPTAAFYLGGGHVYPAGSRHTARLARMLSKALEYIDAMLAINADLVQLITTAHDRGEWRIGGDP